MVEQEEERERLNSLFDELWPLPRSITGPGFRESLKTFQNDVPLEFGNVPSGNEVFDWQVPPEWRIHEAQLTGPDGQVYADLQESNLSVMNYSEPVDEYLTLDELDSHLYTLPDQPDAIPYVTSYYERNWGFCLSHRVYESLPDGEYHAYIDSELVEGELTYGHTVLEGESDREVLLSTYLCHPSLANNELSGPLVMTSLYKRLKEWDQRKFSYRFVVIPETIGSLTYLSQHGDYLRENLVGGLVLTCLGGPEENLSYKRTRREDALIDKTVRHLHEYTDYDFRFRRFDPTSGSDERQYCSPGFNLPVGQFARTVYSEYEEYHTSLDTKEFMGIDTLVESAEIIERVLRSFEYAGYYANQEPYGEPMLSKRDLYPTVNHPTRWSESDEDRDITDSYDEGDFIDMIMMLLNYSDGNHTALEISERHGVLVDEMGPVIDRLCDVGLLEPISYTPEYSDRFDTPEEVRKQTDRQGHNNQPLSGTDIGVGIDHITISRFEDLDRESDDAFLQRSFTSSEIAEAFERRNTAQSLAGRFALKEAVIKALPGTPLSALDLNQIRVTTGDHGEPKINIPENAGHTHDVRGSLAHEGSYAIGFAIAIPRSDKT